MASKRGADNYLTDQNWDQEEDSEEAGVFKQADTSVLQTRQVKKAKRRAPEGDNSGGGLGGAFKGFGGFTGFSKTTTSTNSSSTATATFGGLGGKPLTFNGSASTKTTSAPLSTSAFSSSTVIGDGKDVKTPPKQDTSDDKTTSPGRQKYLQQLKALNEGVSRWIKEHVDKNPYCILTPIFKDYEKYLADIEKKSPTKEDKDSAREEKADEKTTAVAADGEKDSSQPEKATETGGFKFTSKPEDKKESTQSHTSSPAASSLFKFSKSDSSSATVTTTSSSTGLFGASSGATSTPFSFGSTTASVFGSKPATSSGFSFASVPSSGSQDSAAKPAGEEEYVPPKSDVTEVAEDDALYSKRCKLFFKKDDAWKEKGVGNLHLKPCGEKTQLLIRADTNLGNILLNIMLSASLPISRQGKNNVSVVCVPNPPVDPKSEDSQMVPLLIRVKTADDADELFEKLKELKS